MYKKQKGYKMIKQYDLNQIQNEIESMKRRIRLLENIIDKRNESTYDSTVNLNLFDGPSSNMY